MSDERDPVKGVMRPTALAVDAQAIPDELLLRRRWVCWRYVWQKDKQGDGGKWKKPPFDPRSDTAASVTNPDNWCEFDDAIAAATSGRYDGAGLVLCDERAGEGDCTLYCLDIDDCRDASTGVIDEEAMNVIRNMNTWTELSPSGCGVHVWFLASLRVAGRRHGRYEVYGSGRYITLTGHFLSHGGVKIELRQEQAEAVIRDHFTPLRAKSGPATAPSDKSSRSPAMDDSKVISKASVGIGGSIFRDLMKGGHDRFVKDDGTPDHSAADLSFLSRLAFYTQDAGQLERIWRSSARWRDKCEENPRYVPLTIAAAIDTQSTYFDPNFRSKRPHTPRKTKDTPQEATQTPPHCVRPDDHSGGGEAATLKKREKSLPPAKTEDDEEPFASLASIADERVEWMLHPWIARGELNFVVGRRNSGKSCFMAHLISLARLTLVFGASEESTSKMFKPRVLAHGGSLDRVRMAPASGWLFPSCEKRLIEQIRRMGCDLVIIDPIDSYCDPEVYPNDNKAVRDMLESLIRVAVATKVAMVAVRHPGKATDNICPGAASWQNVPRHIVQMLSDGRKPPKRYLSLPKDSLGTSATDTHYELVSRGKGNPPIFTIGKAVVGAEAEIAAMVTDSGERKRVDYAADFIRDFLKEGEQEAGAVLNALKALGIPSSTGYLAKDLLGVKTRRDGGGRGTKHYWTPPEVWPETD